MNCANTTPRIAIACGGTGGHIFPGMAVAEQLRRRGCAVTLLLSPKEVDRLAVKNVSGIEIAVLPAVGLTRAGRLGFLRGFVASFFLARKLFRLQPPQAVLAMGGFTAAPPVFAAWLMGIPAFLHESNTVPGRANRLLARVVKLAFVGFPEAAGRLSTPQTTVTGTPVRPQFQPRKAAACRTAFGLQPDRPVVLVMGGSQGASGINDLVLAALPQLQQRAPQMQWLHLAGSKQFQAVGAAHRTLGEGHTAVVHEFLTEMELALGAATVAVSRAGASSLAELAAMQLPAILIPFPAATDNHQLHNANAFAETNAARILEQKDATPERFADMLLQLIQNPQEIESLKSGLAQWHKPEAADQIAESILEIVTARLRRKSCESVVGSPDSRVSRVGLSAGAMPHPRAVSIKAKEDNLFSEEATA